MKRAVLTSALLLVAVAGSASAQELVGRRESVFTMNERVEAGDWVRIVSPNGDVTIAQGGDRVEIRAEKVVRRGSVEDVAFVVFRGRGGLTVCAVYDDADECDEDGSYQSRHRGWRGSREREQTKVNFTVRIPSNVKVKAASGNGDVSVTGSGEETNASTGNGRVLVSGTTGEVSASSGNGRVTVEGAKGPVHASSGNGDIDVTTSIGPVNASSGNGDIDVAMERLDESTRMEFSTGNGRVRVTVPSDFGAELDSNTGNGSVISDFPITVRGTLSKSRVRGTLGKGGGRLVMTSGNGNIEIRKKA
jgi:hypothetical protein